MKKQNGEVKLRETVGRHDRLAIAYSGGFDSSFLAKFAKDTLGRQNVLLFHVSSPFTPSNESSAAAKFAKANDIPIVVIEINPLDVRRIRNNPRDRCYHCKKAIMGEIVAKAREKGFDTVADGSNIDDRGDYRPGMKATEELGIRHPLLDAGVGKKEMNSIAGKRGYDLSFTPSSACLATRIPYGTEITRDALKMADSSEVYLRKIGIAHSRVRIFGDTACLEIPEKEIGSAAAMRKRISAKLRKIGFRRVVLDLDGYRKGSLNRP